MSKSMHRTKVGLMLGGGGSKGAYQIGVIKALKEADLFDFIKVMSGTSIGAVNTILLMTNPAWEKIVNIWHMINSDGVYGHGIEYSKRRHALVDPEPLYNIIKKQVSAKKVRKANVIGYATAAMMLSRPSLLTQLMPSHMQEVAFRLNSVDDPHLAVLASASIPVFFGITYVDGIPYVDGGILNNYPMQPLVDEKCNLIFCIAVDARFNPALYDNVDITLVDFTAKSVFSKNLAKDLIDSVDFTDRMKDEKFYLGYYVGKMMVQKIRDLGIVKHNKNRQYVTREPGFNYIGLTKEEEKLVKEYRTQIVGGKSVR